MSTPNRANTPARQAPLPPVAVSAAPAERKATRRPAPRRNNDNSNSRPTHRMATAPTPRPVAPARPTASADRKPAPPVVQSRPMARNISNAEMGRKRTSTMPANLNLVNGPRPAGADRLRPPVPPRRKRTVGEKSHSAAAQRPKGAREAAKIKRTGTVELLLPTWAAWQPAYAELSNGNLTFYRTEGGDIYDGVRVSFCAISEHQRHTYLDRPHLELTPMGDKRSSIRFATEPQLLKGWFLDLTNVQSSSKLGSLMSSSQRRLSVGAGYTKDMQKAVRRSKVAAELYSTPQQSACMECLKIGPVFVKKVQGKEQRYCLSCLSNESLTTRAPSVKEAPPPQNPAARPQVRRSRSFGALNANTPVASPPAAPPPSLGAQHGSNATIESPRRGEGQQVPPMLGEATSYGSISKLRQRAMKMLGRSNNRIERQPVESGQTTRIPSVEQEPDIPEFHERRQKVLHSPLSPAPTHESPPNSPRKDETSISIQVDSPTDGNSERDRSGTVSSRRVSCRLSSHDFDDYVGGKSSKLHRRSRNAANAYGFDFDDDDQFSGDSLRIPKHPSDRDVMGGIEPSGYNAFEDNAYATPEMEDDERRHERLLNSSDEEVVDSDNYDDDDDDDYDDEEEAGDWNQRFQTIMEQVATFSPNTADSQKISTNLALIGLAQDFLYSATAYGKIIISEVYLPDFKKTIKPADVGGVAGGSKYIAQDILFKFALDTEGLYGNDDNAAATVAGHELKGLQAYFNCAIPGLRLPLMALVDYRGFRLIAISFLPLNARTLVYGTNDGGKKMHDKSLTMRRMMRRAGEILNLTPHLAGIVPENRKMVYSGADVEGHKGTDNRYYVLDFSRTFPCETPVDATPGINLTRLFRPEFIKSYRTTLCPDAYSSFTDSSYNQDIDVATRHLQWEVIPPFAKEYPNLLFAHMNGLIDCIGSSSSIGSFRLTEAIHSHGINVRYLGLVYTALSQHPKDTKRDAAEASLMLEMLARVIKVDLRLKLRKRMKKLKKPLEEPYRRLVIDYLNLIIGTSLESNEYWTKTLYSAMVKKFSGLVLERDAETDTKPWVGLMLQPHTGYTDWRWLVLQRVQKMIGLKFTARAEKELSANFNRKLDKAAPISRTDLDQIGERIKHMNIVSHAEGYLLMVKAMQNRITDSATTISSVTMAIEKFEEVLNSNTYSKVTLRACAHALLFMEKVLSDKSEAKFNPESQRVLRAIKYLLRAIDMDPTDPQSLLPYAGLLDSKGDRKNAEEYYLRALEADPNYAEALRQYSVFLEAKGLASVAADFRLRLELVEQNA